MGKYPNALPFLCSGLLLLCIIFLPLISPLQLNSKIIHDPNELDIYSDLHNCPGLIRALPLSLKQKEEKIKLWHWTAGWTEYWLLFKEKHGVKGSYSIGKAMPNERSRGLDLEKLLWILSRCSHFLVVSGKRNSRLGSTYGAIRGIKEASICPSISILQSVMCVMLLQNRFNHNE